MTVLSILLWLQVELSKEELETLTGKTKGELADLDEDEKDDDEEKEEMEADDDDDSGEDEGAAGETPEDKEMDEDAKIAKEYGLDDYDDGNLIL